MTYTLTQNTGSYTIVITPSDLSTEINYTIEGVSFLAVGEVSYDFPLAGSYTIAADGEDIEVTVVEYLPKVDFAQPALKYPGQTFSVRPSIVSLGDQSEGTLVWQFKKGSLQLSTVIYDLPASSLADLAFSITPTAYGKYQLVATITTDSGSKVVTKDVLVSDGWEVRRISGGVYRIQNITPVALNYEMTKDGVFYQTGTLAPSTYTQLNLEEGTYSITIEGISIYIFEYSLTEARLQEKLRSQFCKDCGCKDCGSCEEVRDLSWALSAWTALKTEIDISILRTPAITDPLTLTRIIELGAAYGQLKNYL